MVTGAEVLIAELKAEARASSQALGKAEFSAAVLRAIQKVPRERFVAPELQEVAFSNGPLPIGYEQTISQPFIVAVMTDALNLTPDHRVLEIGTGCGYQTAILAELAQKVYTIEIIPELAQAAATRLRAMEYGNVEFRLGDGHLGWPGNAPYDAIIVTACAATIPPPLLDQMQLGGRLVLPIASPDCQWLTLVEKLSDGRIHSRPLLPVMFVPMTHKPLAPE